MRLQTTQLKPKQSLSEKLKDLSKKYGRASIAVYLGISLVDYAVAFALVHQLGTDRISYYEDEFFSYIKQVTGYHKESTIVHNATNQAVSTTAQTIDGAIGTKQEKKGSGIWTEAVIAYGIHKAIFIFARVPITVAITPPLVKALNRRGWNIGPKVT